MNFEISTLMMTFFIIFLTISIWKIYAFLPNKQLIDDDTTKEAELKLQNIMMKVILQNRGEVDNEKLFLLMIEDKDFDKEQFWRFNQNRLNRLLLNYYLRNPDVYSIKDIYEKKDNM